jgi:D-inositol-3-phosphate glycosyltransferase
MESEKIMTLNIQRLRIAMLSAHSSPLGKLGSKDTGGMSVYVRELSRELGRRGHRVDIYTRHNQNAHDRVVELHQNVRLIHLRLGENQYLSKVEMYPHLQGFFRELEKFRLANDLEYDLIHSHYWLSGMLGIWAQETWKRPHVAMFHSLGAVKNHTGIGGPEPEIRIATENAVIKTCHCILAPTQREKERLINFYGASPGKIGVVPCGVDLELFCPMDRSTARRQLGFNPDDTLALFVGRFDSMKGLDTLLEAMRYLKHRRHLRLVIVGGDGIHNPEGQRLLGLARTFGVEDSIAFIGRIEQKDLPVYYNAADVMVMPSYYESFGLVSLEALACGIPVVATPVGVMDTIIKEGLNGQLVANGDAKLLAEAIDKVTSLLPALSADTIRQTVHVFGWPNIASAIIKEYEKAMAQEIWTEGIIASEPPGRLIALKTEGGARSETTIQDAST